MPAQFSPQYHSAQYSQPSSAAYFGVPAAATAAAHPFYAPHSPLSPASAAAANVYPAAALGGSAFNAAAVPQHHQRTPTTAAGSSSGGFYPPVYYYYPSPPVSPSSSYYGHQYQAQQTLQGILVFSSFTRVVVVLISRYSGSANNVFSILHIYSKIGSRKVLLNVPEESQFNQRVIHFALSV